MSERKKNEMFSKSLKTNLEVYAYWEYPFNVEEKNKFPDNIQHTNKNYYLSSYFQHNFNFDANMIKMLYI